jgi:hypothetical protein
LLYIHSLVLSFYITLNIGQDSLNSLEQSTRDKHRGDIQGESNISEVSYFLNSYHLPIFFNKIIFELYDIFSCENCKKPLIF